MSEATCVRKAKATVRKGQKPASGNRKAKFSFETSLLKSGCVSILRSLERSGSGKASDILKALTDGRWMDITGFACDPMDYSDPELYALDYLAVGLLRKSEYLPIDVDRVDAAMSIWHAAEETCRWLNRNGGVDPFEANWDPFGTPALEAVIHTAREKISKLLGRFDWDEAHASFGFSAGASTRLRRKNGHPFYKYSGKPEVTRNAALLAICAIWSIPPWRSAMQTAYGQDPCNWVTTVEGSKVTTVRKTALVDRVIAIEPDMNMFMQRGIGALIRRRLKRVGVDLNDQTHNQRLAHIGSRTGSLATIDLQSASDSISLELVRALLPPDWFRAIELLRCEYCYLPNGLKHRLEKVSSMGNGFTFELESLIFWALSASTLELLETADTRLGIYGDDIVIHNSAADLLVRVLARCGFVTNTDKTFVSGPFRESCGKHYFYGTDVTPFYVKSQTDESQYMYWLANSFREWVGRRGDASHQRCYTHLVDLCRQTARGRLLCVPSYLGSTAGLIVNLDETSVAWCRENQAWRFKRLMPRRRAMDPSGIPALLAWLSAERHETRMVVECGDVRYFSTETYSSQWCLTDNTVNLVHTRV